MRLFGKKVVMRALRTVAVITDRLSLPIFLQNARASLPWTLSPSSEHSSSFKRFSILRRL